MPGLKAASGWLALYLLLVLAGLLVVRVQAATPQNAAGKSTPAVGDPPVQEETVDALNAARASAGTSRHSIAGPGGRLASAEQAISATPSTKGSGKGAGAPGGTSALKTLSKGPADLFSTIVQNEGAMFTFSVGVPIDKPNTLRVACLLTSEEHNSGGADSSKPVGSASTFSVRGTRTGDAANEHAAQALGFFGDQKAALLTKLHKAKADPLAAFSAWCELYSKSYSAELTTPLDRAVYAEFVAVLEQAIAHNSDPETTYVMDTTATLDMGVLRGDAFSTTDDASGSSTRGSRQLLQRRSPPPPRKSPPPTRRPPPAKPPPSPRSTTAPSRKSPPPPRTSNKRSPPPPPTRTNPTPTPAPNSNDGSKRGPPPAPFSPYGLGSALPEPGIKKKFLPPSAGLEIKCPPSVDNRAYLPAIENQGQCGSCWTFGTLSAVEANFAKQTGRKPISFSKQQLVDCATENNGCNGGYTLRTWEYMQDSTVTTWSNYPYTMADWQEGTPVRGRCSSAAAARGGIGLRSYVDIESSEAYIMEALCAGVPVVVVRVVVCKEFNVYSGGLFSFNCPNIPSAGHLVSIVGYGMDAATNKAYWLIRNSWGTSWGENGYMRLVRGRNLCSVADYPSYPTLDAKTFVNVPAEGPTPGPAPGPGPVARSPPPPARPTATKCTSSNLWAPSAELAAKRTGWGQWWAVAFGGDCLYGTLSWSGAAQADVDNAALDGCEQQYAGKVNAGTCSVVQRGREVCSSASAWEDDVQTAKQNTGAGKFYAVAITKDCEWSYRSWNWNSRADAEQAAIAGCNAAAKDEHGYQTDSACGLVATGQAQSQRCQDSAYWESTVQLAQEKTDYGKFWGIAVRRDCGDVWYGSNYASLSTAQAGSLKACNDAAQRAGYGSSYCDVVDAGLVGCEDESAWRGSASQAEAKTVWGKWWAVAVDKYCDTTGYGWNYPSRNSAEAGALSYCKDGVAGACGIAATGLAICADSDMWAAAQKDASARNSWPLYWAVAISKDCTYYTYGWNYGTSDSVKSTQVQRCDDYFGQSGMCGIVASGGGSFGRRR